MKKMCKMTKMTTPSGIRKKYVVNCILFTVTFVRFIPKK